MDVCARHNFCVMPGLVPGIHVLAAAPDLKTWMAGTGPAMTGEKGRLSRMPLPTHPHHRTPRSHLRPWLKPAARHAQ